MTTKIEWADMTINPVVGCTKCSDGCRSCYAETFAARLAKNPKTAAKYAGVVDENGKWTGKISSFARWDDRDMPHRVPGKNKRVFVGSMTDLFHPNVGQERLDTIFASILYDATITNGHAHTFIMLTKRADRMLDYFSPGPEAMLRRWGKAGDGWLHVGDGDEFFSEYVEGQTIPQPDHEDFPNLLHKHLWPLPNLWLGVTVCNQAEADEKIPVLLLTPAAVRFVSVEPCLGPVALGHLSWTGIIGSTADKNALTGKTWIQGNCGESSQTLQGNRLDWVICGGETGPGARPMHPDWVRGLRDQCQAAATPFFFKSWGEWWPGEWGRLYREKTISYTDGQDMVLIGKRRAGRLLDGREWNEVPEVKA